MINSFTASSIPLHPEGIFSVAILSEVRLLRESLQRALCADRGIAVRGLFADLSEARGSIAVDRQDMVLIDQGLPNARMAIRDIASIAPHIQAVVVCVAETPEEVFNWVDAGASGYIPKTTGLAEFVPLLHNIRKGEQACAPKISGALLRRLSHGRPSSDAAPPAAAQVAPLTAREQQIIQLIAVGMSNKEIARSLNIGLATTKTHVHHLLAKMNLRRRGQAAQFIREMTVRS